MRAVVDQDLCTGCGLCVDICPDIFAFNDTGLADAKPGPVPDELADLCRDAAEGCPVAAISIGE